MFTGIIEEIGTVKSLDKTGPIYKLRILAPQIGPTTQPGQSICVNGVCLTCEKKESDLLYFGIMPESLKRTNLGLLQQADKVNLERALRVDGRIDGHFVTGHIDGTGILSQKQEKAGEIVIAVEVAPELLRHIVLKGSVAIDGISLTVSAQESNSFSVNLIPYTLKNTTLEFKKAGHLLNIECDILGKYIDKFSALNRSSSSSSITSAFLKEHGFAT